MSKVKNAYQEALSLLNAAWKVARKNSTDIEAQIYAAGFYDGALAMVQDAFKAEIADVNGEHFITDGFDENGNPNVILRA